MRIGIVCHPSIGGSGLIATQLGIGLAKKGHEVHFISQTRPFKLAHDLQNVYFHKVEGIDYPLFDDPLYTFSLTAKIVEVVEKFSLDIVHAHYSIPHSLCTYLAREISTRKFPTVTTIHGTDVTLVGQDKPLYPLNQFSINKSSIVTTVSNFQAKYIKSHFSINKDIQVINNFIDFDDFSPECASLSLRRKLAEDDEKILMHVSNFRPVKNTYAVLNVFKIVRQSTKAKLVLLGDGPDIEKMKLICKQQGIISQVLFVGNVKNTEQYIANADCVIQPSYHESFSMVSLESMASGVPTVTSNIDGFPEVVKHGETGYIAHPDDSVAMADYIINIFQDDLLQRRLGSKGIERAKKLFKWDVKVEEYIACYRTAISDFQHYRHTY